MEFLIQALAQGADDFAPRAAQPDDEVIHAANSLFLEGEKGNYDARAEDAATKPLTESTIQMKFFKFYFL